MTILQTLWMVASFCMGHIFFEYACLAIGRKAKFPAKVIFGLIGALIAYTVMFAK